jgi:hypothetical protein
MSNIIKLCDRAPRVSSVTPPVESGIDGFRSLFDSWLSITSSLEKLQDYVDQLKPALEAIPDGPEKDRASLLATVAAVQMRDCHVKSIGASAVVARALVSTLRPSA